MEYVSSAVVIADTTLRTSPFVARWMALAMDRPLYPVSSPSERNALPSREKMDKVLGSEPCSSPPPPPPERSLTAPPTIDCDGS